MKEPLTGRVLKISLYAAFAAVAVGAATLPFTLDIYMRILYDAYSLHEGYRMFILIFLEIAALPCLWIAGEMILMLRSIPGGPFVLRNVKALERIGLLFFALALMFPREDLDLPPKEILTRVCGISEEEAAYKKILAAARMADARAALLEIFRSLP